MYEKLFDLYKSTSKHSDYQLLSSELVDLLDMQTNPSIARYENERLQFLLEHLSFKDARILDIGGNTGFFTFESLRNGANEVNYVEGNKEHAMFVREATKLLNRNVIVNNHYINFDSKITNEPFDITLLFNVIHHLGDDFGDEQITLENAKTKMRDAINFFSKRTKYLVLQMGFCWKGDRNLPIFKEGTKSEMIEFITSTLSNDWAVLAIGIAEQKENFTVYNMLDDTNIKRDESLGEFRNRPIFILKSK